MLVRPRNNPFLKTIGSFPGRLVCNWAKHMNAKIDADSPGPKPKPPPEPVPSPPSPPDEPDVDPPAEPISNNHTLG